MDILKTLVKEFSLKLTQAENIVTLIDAGNTIPFIARYRKELTGSLDDQVLRQLSERLIYLRNLNDKREMVLATIDEQGKLTDEILNKLNQATTITEIDDIYRPYRPKKSTRATIAKEKGLEGLSQVILNQRTKKSIEEEARAYINSEKGVETIADAINGAKDIIAEAVSDNADYRKYIRNETFKTGIIAVKGDKSKESVYEMYYDYSEPVKSIALHRVLAINRGEKEGFLSIKVEVDTDVILNKIKGKVIKEGSNTKAIIEEAIQDSYKRLIAPSIEREIRGHLTEKAEDSAVKVFAKNLKQLLMQPPIKDKITLAVDPAFRTGCKLAVVDGTGKVLYTGVIYPTPPQSKVFDARIVVKELISKYDIEVISIGNGTASRETEIFIADTIKEIEKNVNYIIVNEAGASVYSASKLGAEELPDYDVSLRSAVSIGRRLQDPLAELVKIDPKSIGVGQYQHDMNQKKLNESLKGVVEDCVNSVGIDLNTASPALLSYVSGISPTVGKNILKYREEKGKFKQRKELLKVSKLGPKAYEQCAGFLRIPESAEPLDNTGVHPESYEAAKKLISTMGYTPKNMKDNKIKNIKESIKNEEDTANMLGIGVPTLRDIVRELEKPGRDIREDMPRPVLRSDVIDIEDLEEGMILTGTVRNVIDFGAFIDIGVHQDGLVHISELSDKYIKHAMEVVSLGDIVKVKVLSIDADKKRISLTMKGL